MSAPARRNLLTLLSIEGGADPVMGRVRAEQIEQMARFLPFTAATLLLHAVGLVAALDGPRLATTLLAWFALHAVVVGLIIWQMIRVRRREPLGSASARCVRGWAAGAAVLALVWNAILLAVLAVATPGQTVVLASMQLALIGAGAFFFAPVPFAAIAYVGIFVLAHASMAGIAVVQGMGSPFVLVLISMVGLTICRGIVLQAERTAGLVLARDEIAQQRDMVRVLLNEFELNGSDWLWECDAQGRCTHISPKFAELVGMPLKSLIGADMFDPRWGSEAPEEAAALGRAVAARQMFRNLVMRVGIQGETRWWSLSASPKYDRAGTFIGYAGVGSDITEARRSREQIERMANSDPLTGLANRARLHGHLHAALRPPPGQTMSCALILIDLDRFKAVNDTMGHPVGDELLREVATRLRREVATSGEVARLGGDEFAVVLPASGEAEALALTDRLIPLLSEPYRIRGAGIRVGASAGIAVGGRDGQTIDDLMRAADLALYRAKDDGRGVARVFVATLQRAAEDRRQLEAALRLALSDDQLHLHFQPIYDVASGDVRAFEALLRWTHPTLGAIGPARFVPVAEELGLLDTIGEWVIRTALAWAARWPAHVGVAVNLSPGQLVNPRLPGVVLGALAEHGLAAERLELEITEEALLRDNDATRSALAQLARIGVRIGLDDFGTGYSSLGYLRSAAFHTIKIDRSFVQGAVDGQSHSAEIVRHIVSLARALGMQTVAEGAETRAEMDAVTRLGCDHVQGFFLAHPMSPEDATVLVQSAPPTRAARAA